MVSLLSIESITSGISKFLALIFTKKAMSAEFSFSNNCSSDLKTSSSLISLYIVCKLCSPRSFPFTGNLKGIGFKASLYSSESTYLHSFLARRRTS